MGRTKYYNGTAWIDVAPSAQEFDNHLKDYVDHPGTGTTTNAGNAYSVTLTPAPTAYTDLMGVKVKINADSTGAATLNVNDLGAKALKSADGNDFMDLKVNGIYSFVYNSTTGNFILQGEGGLSGPDKQSLVDAVNAAEAGSNDLLGAAKADLADSITAKGVTTSASDSFGQMAANIDGITIGTLGGKRIATGVTGVIPRTTTGNVGGLPFKPAKVFFYDILNEGSAGGGYRSGTIDVDNPKSFVLTFDSATTGWSRAYYTTSTCLVFDGFIIPSATQTYFSNFQYRWVAIEG